MNNNIVLIDAYQTFISRGHKAVDAAIRTAAQRLRPVLLTTITTIVGLFPMVLGWQADIVSGVVDPRGNITSDIFAPISYVIVVGLGFATVLTLILTPVLLAMPTVLVGNFKSLFNNGEDGSNFVERTIAKVRSRSSKSEDFVEDDWVDEDA